MKTTRFITILFTAAGCASATRAPFRNPAYSNRDFTKVAVFAVGMDPDNASSIENQVCRRLAPAQCVSGKTLLPATRTYLPAEIRQSLTRANVDGILVMVLGDDQTASAYLASISPDSSSSSSTQAGTASLYGNIATWIAPSQTTMQLEAANAVPVYTYERTAHAIVGLIDRSNGQTAWGGTLKVTGQGAASVSDRDFVRAATDELVAQLKANRLIRIPATSPKEY